MGGVRAAPTAARHATQAQSQGGAGRLPLNSTAAPWAPAHARPGLGLLAPASMSYPPPGPKSASCCGWVRVFFKTSSWVEVC